MGTMQANVYHAHYRWPATVLAVAESSLERTAENLVTAEGLYPHLLQKSAIVPLLAGQILEMQAW